MKNKQLLVGILQQRIRSVITGRLVYFFYLNLDDDEIIFTEIDENNQKY